MFDNVKVLVRVCPFIKVGDAAPASHWDIQKDQGSACPPNCPQPFSDPYISGDVFGPDLQSKDVYHAHHRVSFVCGQILSIKTCTMMADHSNPAIISLAVHIIHFTEDTPDREHLTRASYVEIYNQIISDLLAGQDTTAQYLNNQEDQSGAMCVHDLKECTNCEDQMQDMSREGRTDTQPTPT